VATQNMIEKVKEIQEQAKAIDAACVTLLGNPNLSDVIQMVNLLEGFMAGKPAVAAPQGAKRVRRTKEQIAAEGLAAQGK
jgi:hypothetical protein